MSSRIEQIIEEIEKNEFKCDLILLSSFVSSV